MRARTPTILALSALLGLAGGVANAAPSSTTPNTAALAGSLANQKIQWGPCTFEDAQAAKDSECAKVTVPRDWHNPSNGKTFQIAISRSGNTDASSPAHKGTLFLNPGGPGGPGLSLSGELNSSAPKLAATHTLIGFDPRGVGQSSTVPCTFTYNTAQPYGIQRAIAETCGSNPDVQVINTEQTAYDMDFIRHLLGVKKLSYLGYSYGTWLGAWYGSVFGANTKAMILDSATNVTAASLEPSATLQVKAMNRQFHEHLMNWIARHSDEYGLGENPAAIYRGYLRGQAAMDPQMLAFLYTLTGARIGLSANRFYPATATFVSIVAQYGDYVARNGAQPTASSKNPAAQALTLLKSFKRTPAMARTVTQAIARAEALNRVAPLSGTVTETLTGNYYYVACQDGQWTQDLKAVERRVARYRQQFPLAPAQNEVYPCNFWKTALRMPRPKADFPKTIVLQSELDALTGWEGGHRTGTHLPNTSLIAVDNEGTHALFPYGRAGVDDPILALLNDGTMPPDISVVQAKPLPKDNAVYESWKPLNKQAQHYGKNVNDPRQPIAGTKGARATSAPGVSEELAEASSEQTATQVVRDIYGQAGLEALKAVG